MDTRVYPNTQLYIDGQWIDAASGRTMPIVNPATGDVIGTLAYAEQADLDHALEATARGFATWKKISAFERSKMMRKAANLLRDRIDHVATLMTMEQGKTIAEAKAEIINGADTIDWFAEEARRTYGRVIPARGEGIYQLVIKEPVGPVAAFTPWNFPINQIVRKLSAALAAGCSIIVKAPEETPASPAELIRAFADAGVPPGVIGLVYGDPAEISSYLIPHPVIRKISFTGSTVGRQAARGAGRRAHEARDDGARRPRTGDRLRRRRRRGRRQGAWPSSKFRNAGQVCISPTRFLVQEGVYDAFVEQFVANAKTLKVGDGLEQGMTMGAAREPAPHRRRWRPTSKTRQSTAARSRPAAIASADKGNFFEPTVVTEVPNDARAMNEEPFGPMAIINPFKTFDDAVTEANRLPFGLAAYACTKSAKTANAIAAAVETGMISINHVGLGIPEVPFGGVKDSGYGSEGGSEAIEPYLNPKFVTQAGI